MKRLNSEEKTKLIEMILSSDHQLIRMALTIACNDGEWIYSFRVNRFENIIDFSRNCMENRKYDDTTPYYFIYQIILILKTFGEDTEAAIIFMKITKGSI